MPVFPNDRQPSKQQSATIFTNVGCTNKATLTTTAGVSIPNSVISVGSDNLWPLFSCAASIVYFKNEAGQVVSMLPNLAGGAVTVTGSKGANAALASLITQLIALGLPITDSTS